MFLLVNWCGDPPPGAFFGAVFEAILTKLTQFWLIHQFFGNHTWNFTKKVGYFLISHKRGAKSVK